MTDYLTFSDSRYIDFNLPLSRYDIYSTLYDIANSFMTVDYITDPQKRIYPDMSRSTFISIILSDLALEGCTFIGMYKNTSVAISYERGKHFKISSKENDVIDKAEKTIRAALEKFYKFGLAKTPDYYSIKIFTKDLLLLEELLNVEDYINDSVNIGAFGEVIKKYDYSEFLIKLDYTAFLFGKNEKYEYTVSSFSLSKNDI